MSNKKNKAPEVKTEFDERVTEAVLDDNDFLTYAIELDEYTVIEHSFKVGTVFAQKLSMMQSLKRNPELIVQGMNDLLIFMLGFQGMLDIQAYYCDKNKSGDVDEDDYVEIITLVTQEALPKARYVEPPLKEESAAI